MAESRRRAAPSNADLLARLMQGITTLTTSEQWLRHLDCQSRFHRYSFGNVLLIESQCPGATRVAGFRTWKQLGRTVRKGEKAIWILAPMIAKRPPGGAGPVALDSAATGAAEGAPVVEDRVIRGFRHVAVFDVAQTHGDELPEICRRLTGEDQSGCYARLSTLAASLGYRVEEAELPGGTNGDCSFEQLRIRVESRNTPVQQVKTLVHEIAHTLLHQHQTDRSVAELEAESTAYVVCRSLGIDSGDYSFGYVATWAGGGEQALAGIRSSGEHIQRAASLILERFEAATDDKAA